MGKVSKFIVGKPLSVDIIIGKNDNLFFQFFYGSKNYR